VIGLFETTAGFYLRPGLIPYWVTPLYFLSPVTYILQVRAATAAAAVLRAS
jgi:hypothetical protein